MYIKRRPVVAADGNVYRRGAVGHAGSVGHAADACPRDHREARAGPWGWSHHLEPGDRLLLAAVDADRQLALEHEPGAGCVDAEDHTRQPDPQVRGTD